MPRPKTKNGLLQLSQKNYAKLISYVDSFSERDRQAEFPEGYLNRNIKDVLIHLHHWHLMFLDWYSTGMKDKKPDMPAKGYTWKTLPDLNRTIWKKYANFTFEDSQKKLHESFNLVQRIIKKHTDEELFEKKKYKWTGTTSLAAYLISATSSHYDWAYKLINKCKKSTKINI